MALVQNFPFFSIILALFSGVLCALLKPKAARNFIMTVLIVIAGMSIFTLLFVLQTGEAYTFKMGHFPAPWGNEIRVGVLETMLAFAFAVVMILSLLGGMHHIFEDVEETKVNLYFLMISLLFSSMLALIYTNDLFTGYVFVEINTIAACAIVMLRNAKETLVATMRYLVLSLLGSGSFLLGICILYDITGHLLMSPLHDTIQVMVKQGSYMFPLQVVIALFCVGLATKSALFPFHVWLPDAHGSATVSSSAILSGLVLKGYIVLLIKIIYRIFGLELFCASKAVNVLFVMGALAMIYGSVKAVGEKDLKRMIAYSSVAQIGYIYMGIGLGTPAGFVAAVFQIIAHALTKPMLFVAAGGFMDVSGGSKQFEKIRGAARRNKLAGAAFLVGALSMIGIPLFAGFITKIYLASASIEAGGKMIPALLTLAASTVLNAMYYVPAIMVVFGKTKEETEVVETETVEPETAETEHVHVGFALTVIVMIVLNIAVGCMSTPLIRMIADGLNMLA